MNAEKQLFSIQTVNKKNQSEYSTELWSIILLDYLVIT